MIWEWDTPLQHTASEHNLAPNCPVGHRKNLIRKNRTENEKLQRTRCVYLIPGRPKSSALRWADSFFHKMCFIALSVLKSFCFNLFRQSFTWSAVADPPFIFLSLPPPILRYSDFMKSLVTARKSFIRSRKLSRRSTMTTLRRERSSKWLSKGEIWERASAAADQRNRTPMVSIAGIAAEVENDRRESVMKHAQAHDMSV